LRRRLGEAAGKGRTIALDGNSSKRLMAGPSLPADIAISTTALDRVLEYEPHDLTISVEAGLPWRDLTACWPPTARLVPLDPPFAATATVGGVVAANCSGPAAQALWHGARSDHRHAFPPRSKANWFTPAAWW